MSLLDDVRAAGLDVRLTPDGRLQIRGPVDVQDRLRNAIRRQADVLVAEIRQEQNPCCQQPDCDHVWCETCKAWANDTGTGPSCHPRHNGRTDCTCENCDRRWNGAA